LTVASDLRNHIAPFFGSLTIDRIKPEDIERYVAAKRQALAVKTIRNHIGTMHLEFPRFRGHLTAERFARSGRMSVDAEDPAVF